MKYDKKIEQLMAAPASTWSDDDVTAIALAIKSHPDDDNLKNAFLNLNPRSEQYCNRAFYISLTSLYFWIVCQYNAIYTLDEFIEAVSYHIWNKSFADWRPGDSLMGYIKYSSLPHGPIGRDIRINYYLLDAVHLDDPAIRAFINDFLAQYCREPEADSRPKSTTFSVPSKYKQEILYCLAAILAKFRQQDPDTPDFLKGIVSSETIPPADIL